MRLLAPARERVFASLDALNDWLAEGIAALNDAPFQKRVARAQASSPRSGDIWRRCRLPASKCPPT
jgi:hypothetical protein